MNKDEKIQYVAMSNEERERYLKEKEYYGLEAKV